MAIISRLPTPAFEEMTPAQQAAWNMIAAPRDGNVNGPFPAWIRMPELCKEIQDVSDILRSNTTFDKAVFEMIVLVTARAFNAKYMFATHCKFALKSGVSRETIDAINEGKRPVFDNEETELVYDVAYEIANGHLLPLEIYNKAVEKFGYNRLTEISTDVGFYLMIASVLNTYDVRPMAGSEILLKE